MGHTEIEDDVIYLFMVVGYVAEASIEMCAGVEVLLFFSIDW